MQPLTAASVQPIVASCCDDESFLRQCMQHTLYRSVTLDLMYLCQKIRLGPGGQMLLNQFSSVDPIFELMGSCMSICEVKMVSLDTACYLHYMISNTHCLL